MNNMSRSQKPKASESMNLDFAEIKSVYTKNQAAPPKKKKAMLAPGSDDDISDEEFKASEACRKETLPKKVTGN